ncbi:MAG: M48 family metallopeptidase [Clostridia bacterium]|nr:M48 family metallopeptidase [Clostridia bacterium]
MMNWKLLILLMLTVGYLYRMILHIIQYHSANNPTPANVADVYDGETYQRWKSYNGEKCRLSIFSLIVSYVLMLVLLCTNAYAAFSALFPSNIYMQLIAVLLFQTVLSAVIDLGFNYAETMVIEGKYGFNRSTLRTFAVDQIRSLILELLISIGLVCILAALHGAMGDWMILLFTAVIFCFTMIISFLYPIFSRMSNKFVPLEDGELKERLMGLLTKHGYHVKAIEVMDASRRTTKLNAYFTGFGKMKTIVLYDNLINAMSTDEICAVFSHELGHGLHKDVLKMQIMNLGNMLVMATLVWLAVREPLLHTAFGFDGVNYGFAYVLLNIGLGLIQPLTGMLIGAYSRFAEFRADRQAAEEGYGAALVTGLKKLAKENFADLSPSRVIVVLEYSHPPLSARIDALESIAKE